MITSDAGKRILATWVLVAAFLLQAYAQSKPTADSKAQIWKKIAPYFSPPASLKNELGQYRSPLKFYDGSEVKSKNDWKKRRAEIRNRWHQLMGQWPALLEDQELQLLDSTHEDGFMQYRVSFNWTPSERTQGYLLVPDGDAKRKRPAVITVYYEPET